MVTGDLPRETKLLVVGGGPGGYAAAFRAADLGLDVTLVSEDARLGGVCLLRGCIPSKALLTLSDLILTAREAQEGGIIFGEPEVHIDAVRRWKDAVVEQLVGGLDYLCERRGVRRVEGRARFTDSGSVRIEGSGGGTLEFQHCIIASGSRPIPLAGGEFDERVMDSGRALDLPDVPQTLLVVGGGYVGLEMGMVYATLGSAVTLVEMTDRLMPRADADLVEPIAKRVAGLFEAIHLETRVTALEEGESEVSVQLEGDIEEPEAAFERVLVAIGRRPNSDDLGLDTTEVEVDDDGFIQVDDQRRTSDARIFAIGDATGGHMLAHEAMHEGKVAAEVIAGEPAAFDARAVPAVVYTDPQLAWCGLTEREAESAGREVRVERFPWSASGRAVSMGASHGMTKLLADPETGRLLGAGVVGPQAEVLISELVLAMEMGAVTRDLASTIHPHPTLSETVGEAAELFLGGSTHFKRAEGKADG
jgi:dihydrolipoamide dehydrogenase